MELTILFGVSLAICSALIILEGSRSGREWLSWRFAESNGLVLVNIVLYLIFLLSLTGIIYDMVGILFSELYWSLILISLPPVVGWAIHYTRSVQGRYASDGQHLDGLAYLIALRARKQQDIGGSLREQIKTLRESGRLTNANVTALLQILGQREDSIGDLIRAGALADIYDLT